MCNAFQPHESYEVCELVRQLGALYDKEREQGRDGVAIKRERRHVSARLIMISTRYESKRMPFFCAIRESL